MSGNARTAAFEPPLRLHVSFVQPLHVVTAHGKLHLARHASAFGCLLHSRRA